MANRVVVVDTSERTSIAEASRTTSSRESAPLGFDTVAWRKRQRNRRKRVAIAVATFEDHVKTVGSRVQTLCGSNEPSFEREFKRALSAQRALNVAAESLRAELHSLKSVRREWCGNFATELQRRFDPLFAGLGIDDVEGDAARLTPLQRANANLTTAIWKRGGSKRKRSGRVAVEKKGDSAKRRKS